MQFEPLLPMESGREVTDTTVMRILGDPDPRPAEAQDRQAVAPAKRVCPACQQRMTASLSRCPHCQRYSAPRTDL